MTHEDTNMPPVSGDHVVSVADETSAGAYHHGSAATPVTALPSVEPVQNTASYTIVQDLAETIVDLDSRYEETPHTEANVAYAVATVESWNQEQQQRSNNSIARAPSSAEPRTSPAVEVAAASVVASSEITEVYATPCGTNGTLNPEEQNQPHNLPYASTTSPVAAAAARPEHLYQEEKEEITGLAGLQTAGLAMYAETATVIRNGTDDDAAELARMKRAAYNSSAAVDEQLIPDQEPQPEPLTGEDFSDFYGRTIDHWNILAAERLTGSGSDLNLSTLEDESTRMASQRWQEMQPAMNAHATVVSISEEDVHPSDLGAIQAELIGQQFPSQGDSSEAFVESSTTVGTQATTAYASAAGGTVATAVTTGDDTTTEATVIDTAPLAKEDAREAWERAEEAQVLENAEVEAGETRKPPATGDEGTNQYASAAVADDGSSSNEHRSEYAVADQEGLVLAIEDDVHPSDFQTDDADAQVVGADFDYAVADPEATGTHVAAVEGSVVESESNDGTAEVQAILVEGGSAVSSATGTPTTALDTSHTVSVLPTESITVEEEQEDEQLDTPTKEVPWSGPTSHTSTFEPDTNLDDDYNRDDFAETPPPPPTPSRESFGNDAREQSAASATSERSSASSQRSQLHNISSNIARSTTTVMDALFGDSKGPFVGRKSRASESDITGSVSPRTLLPWSVIFSPANKMWVATLQTSQKALDSNDITEASKALRAFSLPTEMQAISLARAWTPPRMMGFNDNPACHICRSKFAVFRRACHCRNCGVCVCKDCTVQWPSNMVPDTYNTKCEVCVNACKSCDWISNAFRLALLNGNMDESMAIHATGNINVTCPFSNVKGELFYPVHCAVLGGNLQLLKWLVDEQCCPIKSVRVSGKSRESAGRYTPIVTSKGRSLLGIAMENCYLQIVRYLVVDKGIVIAGERDITHEMLTRNLTRILRVMPDETGPAGETEEVLAHETAELTHDPTSPTPTIPDPDGNIRSLSDGARDFGAIYAFGTGQAADECIICFDGKIDCVATPCGHQICCLKCSMNVERCPVCAQDCSFMRVFKP